jgi:hypothetical protein
MTKIRFYSSNLALLFSLFMAVGLFSQTAHAASGPTAAEYGVVLNLSGKQRMLSQKMSKEAMLVALDINKAANLKSLKATASLFDKTLKGLRNGDKDLRLPKTSKRRILKQLGKVDKIWAKFNGIIQGVLSSGSTSKAQVA